MGSTRSRAAGERLCPVANHVSTKQGAQGIRSHHEPALSRTSDAALTSDSGTVVIRRSQGAAQRQSQGWPVQR